MSTVTPVGGEMELWDEPDPPASALAGALVAHVLTGRAGPLLLLGPHPAEVLDAVEASGAEATVLLRSQPAAERLVEARPGLHVLCGDPGRAPAGTVGGPFSTLVALAGVDAAASADADWRSWERLAREVLALCTSDALLVLGHERTVGTAALSGAPRRGSGRDPGRWFGDLGHDATRPRDATALAAALGRADDRLCSWIAAPSVREPDVLLPAPWVPTTTGTLAGALLERAAAEQVTAAGPLTRDAIAQGLAATLAPAEVAVVGAQPDARAWVGGAAATVVDRADLDAPADLLLARMLERCARHDVPGLAEDLAVARDWATSAGAGLSCLPEDVLLGPGGPVPVPASPEAAPRDDRQALALLSLSLATTIERLGWDRPWPRDLDADGLACVVAGLLGVELGRGALDDVRPLLRAPADVAPDGARVRRLEDENAALRGRTRALENALRSRDRQMWTERSITEGAATSKDRKTLRKEAKPPPVPPTTSQRVRRRIDRLRPGG